MANVVHKGGNYRRNFQSTFDFKSQFANKEDKQSHENSEKQ